MKIDNPTLQQIADVAFAMALGMRMRGETPSVSWANSDLNEWLAANHEPAVDFINDYLASTASRDAAARIARAHDSAASVTVGEPTSDDIRDITNRLNSISQLIENDQAFHAALDTIESLARAVKAG